MSVYLEYIRGMMDNVLVSKAYWCKEKDMINQQGPHCNIKERTILVMDKLVALDRDIKLFDEIIKQFERYDNES